MSWFPIKNGDGDFVNKIWGSNQEQCLSVGPPYLEMLFYMMVDIVTYIMLYHVISFFIVNPTGAVKIMGTWEHPRLARWQDALTRPCRSLPRSSRRKAGARQPSRGWKPRNTGKIWGNEQKGRSDFKTTLVYWAQNSEERQVLQRKHDVEGLAFTCLFCFGEPVLRALQQITDHARWIPQESQLILVSPRNSGGCPLYLGHVGVCREKTRRDSSCCLCNWANTTTLSFHSESKWRSFSCLCWQLLRSRPPEYPDMQIRFWVWLN